MIPIAGDDEQAKLTVAGLIEEIGFGPLDTSAAQVSGETTEPQPA